MLDVQQLAINMISRRLQQDPRFGNDPNTKAMVEAIQNNDSQSGEAIANQILAKVGLSREEGLRQATLGLGLK